MNKSKILSRIIIFICLICNVYLPCTQSLAKSKIRVAFFTDKGAHPGNLLCTNLAQDKSLALTNVSGNDICNDCLENFDVLFVPGGSGKREALSLTPEGQMKVRLFVRKGGIYLGVCAGCYLASCARPQYLGLLPMTTADQDHWRRGKATLPIEFTKLGMEIFGVEQAKAEVIYHNGPVLRAYKQYENNIAPLSYFRGELVARGGETGVMINAPAMVLARYGNGLVLGISPHPEATTGLATIELNAIEWLYNHRPIDKQSSAVIKTSQANTVKVSARTIQLHNSLSAQIYEQAESIFENTTYSHYQHLHEQAEEQAQQANGKFQVTADCSGFISYVINAVSPQHYAPIYELSGRSYPHAKTYTQFFSSLPNNEALNGWLRIENFKDLKRGDIIAWERPNRPGSQTKHNGSGHVMIVVNKPSKLVQTTINGKRIKYFEICVLDSSSVEHFPPQSLPLLSNSQFRDGVGKGMVRLILDEQDNIIGFWEGTFSHERNAAIKGPSYTGKIAFARLVSSS